MKNVLFFLLVIGILPSCSEPTSQEKTSTDDLIKKVEASLLPAVYFEGDSLWTIEERMKHYGVPGVSIAVIRDNKIEWIKGYGITDKESKTPVTSQTLFQAGSISKPVSAYGALKMVEQKKFDLDENINTYLKSWKLPDNEFTKDKKVTLKQLLSHSGGVTVHGFLGYSPGLPVPTLLQVLEGAAPANSPAVRVDKTPGEGFRYSGGGYCIMQEMMIEKEGKTFPQLMHDLVLQPLGMNNSTYDQPLQAKQLKTAATGYLPDGTVTKGKRHTYPEMAPAGLWSTAEDLAKFAINIQQAYKGEQTTVLSKNMVTAMLTPVVKDFIGLGIFLNPKKSDIYFGHGGWDEGFSSQLIAHKHKGYGVVVLTNSNHPAFIDELIRAVAFTYDWDNYVPVYKKANITPEKIPQISGRYRQHKDGLIKIYSSGNKVYKKNLGTDPIEIFKVSDSTYIGHDNQLIMFKPNPRNGQWDLQLVNPNNGNVEFNCERMKETEKLPFELLEDDEFEKALTAYQAIKKSDSKDRSITEENLNQVGYNLLTSGKGKLAQDLFKINTILYPFSSNAYDSYAEACMKNNNLDLAIENYKLSLKLNSKNTNAVKMLEELQKKKGA